MPSLITAQHAMILQIYKSIFEKQNKKYKISTLKLYNPWVSSLDKELRLRNILY